MRHTYRFDTIPELRGATLDVTRRGSFVSLRPRGFRSPRLLALTCVYFFWMDLLRPIETSDDGLLYSLYIPPLPGSAHNRQVEGYLRKWLAHDPAPMAVTIAVTGRCQCACPHCSATMGPERRSEMTTGELRRVVAEALDLGVQVVTFTGGEPLLRDDLEEVVASVPREQAVTLAFTNALLLDTRRARSLKQAGLFGIHISLDSPDPAEHDRLRGPRRCVRRRRARRARRARRRPQGRHLDLRHQRIGRVGRPRGRGGTRPRLGGPRGLGLRRHLDRTPDRP